MLAFICGISFYVFALPHSFHSKNIFDRRVEVALLYEALEQELMRDQSYSLIIEKIDQALHSFGKNGRSVYELYFAPILISCFLKTQQFEDAREWSKRACQHHEPCLVFFRIMSQVAESQGAVKASLVRDLAEVLQKWDGTFRPFKGLSFRMPLGPQTLEPWLGPLFQTAVFAEIPELFYRLMKRDFFPAPVLMGAWLEVFESKVQNQQQAARVMEVFKKSVLSVEKKVSHLKTSEPKVALLFLKTQISLEEGAFESAWQQFNELLPPLRALAQEKPEVFGMSLFRALWGQYFSAAELGMELEAIRIFLEIKKSWPESNLIKLREPYHVYWFANRNKAYPHFMSLLEEPLPDKKKDPLQIHFSADELKKIMLLDMFHMGEWSWAGELLVRYPELKGYVAAPFEAFARTQFLLQNSREDEVISEASFKDDLEVLRLSTGLPFFPITSVMLLIKQNRFNEAREACFQRHTSLQKWTTEDEMSLVFGPLFQFLEDCPPSAELVLFEDALRELFDERLPELSLQLQDCEISQLSPSHERLLEKIFEPMCGAKRLHQVHVKRRSVEALFEALGYAGGFGRFGKGSHHVVGLEVEGHRFSTVLSAEKVPPYQIRQLQLLLLKAGILPLRFKDQLTIERKTRFAS
jgi:hypothetical protein